ncbi:MAG: type II secretion system protein [Candidatus Saccharimonas aalborgensis]
MRLQRGDTIIEVMFSFVVFSLVIVGAFTLMNQGIASAQRSLEITLVREQIDAQIDMARYVQKYERTTWENLIKPAPTGKLVSSVPEFGTDLTCPVSASLSNAFFFGRTSDAKTVTLYSVGAASYGLAPTYGLVDYLATTPKSYGIWLMIVPAETKSGGPADSATNKAYDLHVRSCWNSVGSNQPMTIGTVTRFYDVK